MKVKTKANQKDNSSQSSGNGSVADKRKSVNIQKTLSRKNMLKLNKIVLENFKSFEGKHEIGYFLDFSVVLGPNGSGKSNIIDAICFALGMKTNSLRTKNLKDLIYKKEYEEVSQRRTSFVEIIFTKDGEDLSFKRTITQKGASDFFFNDKKMQSEEYMDKLEEFNIPSKARYFILVQGAIDTLLSKKNDLTETIELLSGSYDHKADYDRVRSDLETLNMEINKVSNEMNGIKDDRNKVKTQIENEEKYNELMEKLNKAIEKTYLYKLAEMDISIQNEERNLTEIDQSMKAVQNEKKETIDYVRVNEMEVKKFDNETKQIEKESADFKMQVEALENQKVASEDKMKMLETQIFTKVSMMNQHKIDKKKKDEKKYQLQKHLKELEKEIEEIRKKIDKDEMNMSQSLNKTQLDEYRKISTQLDIETFQLGKVREKIQFDLTEINNEKSIKEKNFTKVENEKNNLEKEIKTVEDKIDQENTILQTTTSEIAKLKMLLAEKENCKLEIEGEQHKIKMTLNDKLTALSRFESDNTENVKKKKISELMNKDPNVFGFLYELIVPLQKKLELPVKVSLLKYLNYLVVENSETAKMCSDFLKGKELNSDVLVLENIPAQDSNEALRLKLGNLGNLLVDLIDCKKKGLKNALNFFLKDTVLCYEAENVQKLKSKGFNSIILLDGTQFKKGTISGGNYRNLDQYSFNTKSNNLNEIEKLKREIDGLNDKLQKFEFKLEDQKEISLLRGKIVEKENLSDLCRKNITMMTNQQQKYKVVLEEKEKSYNDVMKETKLIGKKYEEMIVQLEKTTKQKNEMKEKMFEDFMRKHNFKTLTDFEQFSLGEIKRLSEELKNREEKQMKLLAHIDSLDAKDEIAERTEKSLQEDKESLKQTEKDLMKISDLKRNLNEQWEEFKGSKNENYKRINQIKEMLKLKQIELEKNDKRIRSLVKAKIESEHKIIQAIDNKKSIIEESKLNTDNILKELGEVYHNSSVFVSSNVNIDRYVIANENVLGKINFTIDYAALETKTKIDERSIDSCKIKLESIKTKITSMLTEMGKYVKVCALNETEAHKLKDKEGELSRKKKNLFLQVQTLIGELDVKKDELEKIKTERKDKFNSFFADLSKELVDNYKDLTKSGKEVGGSAYIYNTNEDEPYLGTVCYLPTPPGKRVIYDIDQLSGGEKTIAILGLIVSIQKIARTPFIILDEIDAYLDPEHEAVLENLFKSKHEYQLILVTHKKNIFRSAHALIGTYFNKHKYSSIPISIDMTKI